MSSKKIDLVSSYASQAMASVLSQPDPRWDPESLARYSFKVGKAMYEQRELFIIEERQDAERR